MQENIELAELEKSLINLKTLTEKMGRNLDRVNMLIRDNINSGAGVWDSEAASLYRQRWESLMEDFPKVVETFRQQETNLEQFLLNMKKVERS